MLNSCATLVTTIIFLHAIHFTDSVGPVRLGCVISVLWPSQLVPFSDSRGESSLGVSVIAIVLEEALTSDDKGSTQDASATEKASLKVLASAGRQSSVFGNPVKKTQRAGTSAQQF